jgi:hypothetical protein
MEQEVAIMKKVDHPNCIKLHEVIHFYPLNTKLQQLSIQLVSPQFSQLQEYRVHLVKMVISPDQMCCHLKFEIWIDFLGVR